MLQAMEQLAVEPCSVAGCRRAAQPGRKGFCLRHFFAERAERAERCQGAQVENLCRQTCDTAEVSLPSTVAEAVELCEELDIPFEWVGAAGLVVGRPGGLRYHVTNERGWQRVVESKIGNLRREKSEIE